MVYSTAQQVALALIPKLSGSVGILSSIFIVSEIFRDYMKNEMNPIKRTLLGVTCFEVMDSFGWWLSTWAIPSTSDFVFASGSRASCNFQGFLLQVAIGAPLHNGFLTYIFYLIVKEGRDFKAINSIEKKVHPLIAIFAVGTGILLLVLKIYNPTNQVCWINGYPSGCDESVLGGSDIPCERGFNAYLYGMFFFYFVLWSVIIFMTYLNLSMRRYLLKTNSSEAQWVTTQALLFSCSFFITWTPSTLWSVLTWIDRGGFWLDVLSAIFEPLQGFWNLLIFFRNRPDSILRIQRILTCKCFSPMPPPTEEESDDDSVDSKLADQPECSSKAVSSLH